MHHSVNSGQPDKNIPQMWYGVIISLVTYLNKTHPLLSIPKVNNELSPSNLLRENTEHLKHQDNNLSVNNYPPSKTRTLINADTPPHDSYMRSKFGRKSVSTNKNKWEVIFSFALLLKVIACVYKGVRIEIQIEGKDNLQNP